MIAALLVLLLAASPGRGYKASTPIQPATVADYGDSIFAGACGTPVMAALDAMLPPGYGYTTHAISGYTPHQAYVAARSGAATACLGEPCGTYAVNGGVNTLKNATYAALTPAQVASIALNGNGTCDTVVSDSCGTLDTVDFLHAQYPYAQILVAGVLPYAGCDFATCPSLVAPGLRARAYNAALASACADRPWLRCIIPYSDFEEPGNPDFILPSIACSDGIHLLAAGHQQLAALLHAAGAWR